MSENDKKNVRRFGRRTQKDKLTKPDSLFPDEDDVVAEKAEFDMASLNLPDTDTEALAMLSSLQDEVKAPIITPKEERYPPLAPSSNPQITPQKAVVSSPTPQKSRFAWFYNLMTVVFLFASCATIVWFGFVWVDPQSALNPFSPPTPFVVVTVLPDESEMVTLDATPDDSGQIFVVITDTPMPTSVSTESPFPFIADTVLYAPNSNELGCNWWSIAGTVSDLEGNPLSGYRIRIIGDDLDEAVFSGASQAFGDGGYELPLVGTPREAVFTVQLFSPQDAPLSREIRVTTQADCESNVAVLNFIQNR